MKNDTATAHMHLCMHWELVSLRSRLHEYYYASENLDNEMPTQLISELDAEVRRTQNRVNEIVKKSFYATITGLENND